MTATDPVQAVAEALDVLNADGWMVVPHPNTGEPMQERLPVSYLAEAAVAAARPAIEAEALREVRRSLEDAVGAVVPHSGGSAGVYESAPNGDSMHLWSYGNAVAYTGAVREVLALLADRIEREGQAE